MVSGTDFPLCGGDIKRHFKLNVLSHKMSPFNRNSNSTNGIECGRNPAGDVGNG